jgi:hypothetical protein
LRNLRSDSNVQTMGAKQDYNYGEILLSGRKRSANDDSFGWAGAGTGATPFELPATAS